MSDDAVLEVLGSDAGFEEGMRWLRKVLMGLCVGLPLFWYYTLSHEHGLGYVTVLPLLAVVGALAFLYLFRQLFRVELVLDRERQQLLLRRRFLWIRQLVPLAGLEELWGAAWAGEFPAAPVNYWWEYVTFLITRQGRRFRASRHGDNHTAAARQAERLAKEFELEFLEGETEQQMVVRPGPETPSVHFRSRPRAALDCCAVVFWGLFLTLALPAGCAVFLQ